jgi:5-(carboxyamino)imidazole ribonucleotide synthase
MSSILPGAPDAQGRQPVLGVLGGGQLGRMFVHAAQQAGYGTVVLEPDAGSPAGLVAHRHLVAPYADPGSLHALAQDCAAVTTEFENVPTAALQALADASVPVCPSAAAVAVCQHRAHEKRFIESAGVPCAPFAVIDQASDLDQLPAGLFPGLLKTASLGYDGKGQVAVPDAVAAAGAWDALGRVACVLERRLALAVEFSVIVARDRTGRCVHLPVQQNLHRDGILAVTQAPAPDVPPVAAEQGVTHAMRLAEALAYVGVLCVEFFLLRDGSLVANEMAPRPHNSGHYSLDACDLSQFDLQVRTLAGLPLVAPRQHSAAVMLNLLGDLWWPDGPSGAMQTPPWDRVLALSGAHLHLYGKAHARPGRKMGHLTFTAPTPEAARDVAHQACALLGLPTF